MFKKILVATDGSEHAQRALEVAGNLAARYDADLVVLNVFSSAEMSETTRHMAEVEHLMPVRRRILSAETGMTGAANLPLEPDDDNDYFGVMYRAAEKISQRIADDGAQTARKAGAAKVRTIAQEGDPAEAILNAAKDDKVDLIVVGSRGLGSLKGLLMGSVSSKVVHLSDCCCITVK